MNGKILHITAGFIIGAACGVGGTLICLKKKYETKAAKEISKARATFHRMLKEERAKTNKPIEEEQVAKEETERPIQKEDVLTKSYSDLLVDLGYKEVPEMKEIDTNLPYLIDAGMYGHGGFPAVTLIWYSEDDILCREEDGLEIKEIEELLGESGTDLLASGVADRFYVRNEELKIDICVEFECEGRYYEDHPQE